jgi:alpha-ketoglutarate-dependent taurine dioxygenase
MWDNLRSLHRGSFDYTDDEPRLIERCQILSDKITDQAWVKSVLARVPATV